MLNFKTFISKPITVLAVEISIDNIQEILFFYEEFLKRLFEKNKFLRFDLNDKYVDKYDLTIFTNTFKKDKYLLLEINKKAVFCLSNTDMFVMHEDGNVFSIVDQDDFKIQFDYLT